MSALPESFKALARAEEAIDAAASDIREGFYLAAANRAYYCCYYCMLGLLMTENVTAKTHQGIRAKFSELFIKTKIFPASIAVYIKNAFELRQEADYDLDAEISKNVADELLDTTREVYQTVYAYIIGLHEK